MATAEYVWFCECCGLEHVEEMGEDHNGSFFHHDEAYAAGWRQVSNGERLIECCPDCMRTEYWRIAAGTHIRGNVKKNDTLSQASVSQAGDHS